MTASQPMLLGRTLDPSTMCWVTKGRAPVPWEVLAPLEGPGPFCLADLFLALCRIEVIEKGGQA